jgi:hypothetical protein
MKKAFFSFLLFLLLCVTLPSTGRTDNAKMVFWYPGEAGSTEDAQPVIDAFLDYLSRGLAPNSVTGKYFNTIDGGLRYISGEKPKVGVVSFAAWTENRGKLGNATVMLAALPLPQGKTTEQYALVGIVKDVPAGATIYSSEPFTKAFIKEHLFAELPEDAAFEQTDRIFVQLKDIAGGKEKAFAILTPMEAASLKKLSSPWVKPLRFLKESKAVSTARVVLFDPSWKDAVKLSEVLISSGNDPQAIDILEEMRLKGFAKPQ